MAISDKRIDSATFTCRVTNIVRFWLEDEDEGSTLSPFTGRCGQCGPCRAVLEAEDLAHGAEALREWFTERLTADPRSSEALRRLSSELMEATLHAVDWLDLADEIRD